MVFAIAPSVSKPSAVNVNVGVRCLSGMVLVDAPLRRTLANGRGGKALMRKKILYVSVHEALEYDDLRILHAAGYDVFSVGAFSDPAAQGRLRSPEPYFARPDDFEAMRAGGVTTVDGKRRLSRSFVDRFDIVLVNHDPKVIIENRHALENVPVIRRTLGQTSLAHEQSLAPYKALFKTVRYSPREDRPGFLPADAVIYFGKFPDQYQTYRGGDYLLTFANDTTKRPLRPKATDYATIVADLPARLHGFGNETVANALGVCAPGEQAALYANCRAYVYVHSTNAAYTLNFMEALLTGCPVLAPSARFIDADRPNPRWAPQMYEIESLLSEGAGLIYDSVEEARDLLRGTATAEAGVLSQAARARALQYFDAGKIVAEWRAFIEANT